MPNIRIIPCLDVRNGRVVKGTRFVDLQDIGDPAERAAYYEREGADELVFLDITATTEGRGTMLEAVRRTAAAISIPLTVGGGIDSIEAMKVLLESGASRVSINTAALNNPALISAAAERFSSKALVVAIDARRVNGSPASALRWKVVTHGGQRSTGRDPVQWAVEAERLGAGEILLTSMDADGTRSGYDIPLLAAVSRAVSIPVIASGGAGTLEHLYEAVTAGGAQALLAASILHYGSYTISEIKSYLAQRGVPVSGNFD